jgi:hypothetical protein
MQRTNGETAVTRARAEEYRRLAQECLIAARTVTTDEARAVLIERAEFWFQRAQEQDDENSNIERPVPPIPSEESQPSSSTTTTDSAQE